MKEYTEAIHAQRLIKMLQQPEPCTLCPVMKRYQRQSGPEMDNGFSYVEIIKTAKAGRSEQSRTVKSKVCKICRAFIGFPVLQTCPCFGLGGEEAIRQTWKALEEKGYLKEATKRKDRLGCFSGQVYGRKQQQTKGEKNVSD